MAERVASLSAYSARFYELVDDDAMRRISRKAGFAGKDAAFEAARAKLGPDRAMSNFKSGRVRLAAGFDQGVKPTQVIIGHRPAGLWSLADAGRKESGAIFPRNGRRKGTRVRDGRAVMTPAGPRARSSYGSSRGLGVFKMAAAKERDQAPEAAFHQLQAEIKAVIGLGITIGSWGDR
jgi:hypothetical protein